MATSQSPKWLTGRMTIALWVVTMIAGYFALGGFLQETVEGIDGNQIPKWPLAVFYYVFA